MITRRSAAGSNRRRTGVRRLFLPGRGRSVLAGLLLVAASGSLVAQTVKEFKVPYASTDPRGITTGADGNLWFADYLGFAVVRMTPAGVFTKFPTLTLDATPVDAKLGPDGNVWFTEYLNNQVGRITPTGTMTEFPLPCVNPPYCFESIGPYGIAVGPDGNFWIAEVGGKIGRVTPAGAATNFDTPSSQGKPEYIAAGADGNLWFTESFANKIGRITTAGKVTEFSIPSANSTPMGIAAGPDGNLWFVEEAGNRVARITTSGVITEFPALSSPVLPMAITAGPDGNLWFTELGNHLGRVTPAGEITEFPLPDLAGGGAFGNGITSGPDGNLWLTRASASESRITRFTPPPPASAERLSTLPPCRLVDTRNPNGPTGGPALRAGTDRLFTLAGVCGIPLSARAVAINVTVTEGSASGHLTAYPAGTTMPVASLINYAAGQTRANNGILALGAGGAIEVRCGQSSGTVEFILDVAGYLQ